MLNEILEDAKVGMQKSLNALDSNFKKIRTGRANPSVVEDIKVDYYGNPTPLSQVANISVEDAKTLAISPYESDLVKEIERSIMDSDLGINPTTSGTTIRIIIPELTEETRRELTKKAKSEAENTKVLIRNVRREGNSQLKEFLKEKEISQDEERQGEEEMQRLTDEFISKVDESLALKEKDLLDF